MFNQRIYLQVVDLGSYTCTAVLNLVRPYAAMYGRAVSGRATAVLNLVLQPWLLIATSSTINNTAVATSGLVPR